MGGCWREKTIVTTLEALGPGARAGLHFLLRDNNKKTHKEQGSQKRERLHSSELLFIAYLKRKKRKIRYAAERELKEAAHSHVQKHRRSDVCRPISQAIIFRPHFNFRTIRRAGEFSSCTVGHELSAGRRLRTLLLETQAQQITPYFSLVIADSCVCLRVVSFYGISRKPVGGSLGLFKKKKGW